MPMMGRLELVPTVLKEVIDVIFRHIIYIYIYYVLLNSYACHSCERIDDLTHALLRRLRQARTT